MRQRAVLEVDGSAVRLTTFSPRRVIETRVWPRSHVAEARLNRSNGKLLLVITGRDLVDINVSPSHEVTEWVAREVDAALRSIPAAASSPMFDADAPTPPMQPGAARTALVTIAVILSLAGVVLVAMFGPVGLPLFLLAAFPAGLALGSQKKEFWM